MRLRRVTAHVVAIAAALLALGGCGTAEKTATKDSDRPDALSAEELRTADPGYQTPGSTKGTLSAACPFALEYDGVVYDVTSSRYENAKPGKVLGVGQLVGCDDLSSSKTTGPTPGPSDDRSVEVRALDGIEQTKAVYVDGIGVVAVR